MNFTDEAENSSFESNVHALAPDDLQIQNEEYLGTGGRSQENRHAHFVPAFKDRDTNIVYSSKFGDGRTAPFHCIDGLPEDAFTDDEVPSLKTNVIVGFIREGKFFTRDEAAAWMNNAS